MSFMSLIPMFSGLLGGNKSQGGKGGNQSNNNQALLNWAQNEGRTRINNQYAQLGIPNSTARAMDIAGNDTAVASLGAGLNQQNFQNMLQLAQLANQGAGQGSLASGFNSNAAAGQGGQSTTPGGAVGDTTGAV